MRTLKKYLLLSALGLGFLLLPGCDSTGVDYNNMPERAGVGIGGGGYYGMGYDPWYYGAGYYPPAVVVVPPRVSMPPPHVSPR